MNRRVRLKAGQSPDDLAGLGKGDKRELIEPNKHWLSPDFQPWNPGQQINVPNAWTNLPDEYASE